VQLHFTAHAQKRAEERGISLDEMKAVIKYAQKGRLRAGVHGGTVYKFVRASLVVVAEIKESECWVITAYRL
jgi:hypothetical protein